MEEINSLIDIVSPCMYVVKLHEVRSYGFRLSPSLFYVRFKLYRDGRLKTSKILGIEANLEKSCRAILSLRRFTYTGTLNYDGRCVKMSIPRDIVSMLFNGLDNRYVELWLIVRKNYSFVEIFEAGQRKIDDYILDVSFFNPIIGLKSPRYDRGYRYCSRCREGYLVDVRSCPKCGSPLRTKPRSRKMV